MRILANYIENKFCIPIWDVGNNQNFAAAVQNLNSARIMIILRIYFGESVGNNRDGKRN